MNKTLEKFPALLRKFISKYNENPAVFNFMDSKNEIWIIIHDCMYSIKFFIEDRISRNHLAINDSHDVWVSYEFEKQLRKMYLDPYLLRNKIKLDFNYSDQETFRLLFQVELKKDDTIFSLSENNADEWLGEKLSGDYGKLYKILKENSPIDMTELTHKTRFLSTDMRRNFINKMLEDQLIIAEKITAKSRKTKNIYSINEKKVFESVINNDSKTGISIKSVETPMPERFKEKPMRESVISDEITKRKERNIMLRESGVNFHESVMIRALFDIAGKALEYIHQIYPRLNYVVKITVQDKNYDVTEFSAKPHRLVGKPYIDEQLPEDFYERVTMQPYKVFINGYIEFVRNEHPEYRGPFLYDGEHVVNYKKVYIEIDFKENKSYDSQEIIDTLPEKIEEYFESIQE